MASNKQELIRWFYRQPLPEGELRFDDLLAVAAQEALDKDAIAAAQYVIANAPRHWNELITQSRVDVERGLRPLLRVTDAVGRKAVWYPRLATSILDNRQKRAITLSAARPRILRQVDLLSDREYEAFCCVVMEQTGADRVKLTPSGNEGGIDLFAHLRVPATTHLFGGACTPVRIVGQCKQYAGPVSVDRVRDFIATMESVRNQSGLLPDGLIPSWFKAATGPLIGWVASNSGWQSGAQTLANSHGLVLSSSVDLAEVLAQARRFFPGLSPEERAAKVPSEVQSALQLFG